MRSGNISGAIKRECEKSSITEIAQACGVSPGAVTRLMKKIGLEGFTEFKIALRWQNREASAIPLNLQGRVESDYLRTLEMSVHDRLFADVRIF